MPGSVIVGGARTPIGKLSRALKGFSAMDNYRSTIGVALCSKEPSDFLNSRRSIEWGWTRKDCGFSVTVSCLAALTSRFAARLTPCHTPSVSNLLSFPRTHRWSAWRSVARIRCQSNNSVELKPCSRRTFQAVLHHPP